MGKVRHSPQSRINCSRRLTLESLENRQLLAVTSQDLLGIGILQRTVDEIENSPYQSQILSQDILDNVVAAIAKSQTPTGVTNVINTDAGLATIATGGPGKTYHIIGDRTLPNGTDINVPAHTTIYVDGSIYKQGQFIREEGLSYEKENTGSNVDTIFKVLNDNVRLIGVNNALLHSNPDLRPTEVHATAVYIDGNADNVVVDGFEIANVWEGVVTRFGTSNVLTTNNHIHDTAKRAIWNLGSDNSRVVHNFVANAGWDTIDFDAFTDSNIAYENVSIGAGRWAGFVEEAAHDSFFVRGISLIADMGNPNRRYMLGWADNGTSAGIFQNSGQQTRDNYFIDNVSFDPDNIPNSGGDYFAKAGEGGKGPTYFWANRGYGAGQSTVNFVNSQWLTYVPTSGGTTGKLINGTRVLAKLDAEFNGPIVVDIAADESDGDYSPGELSLREAIELANEIPGHRTIVFDDALSGATISLVAGELTISDTLTIDASSLGLSLTIDAGNNSRIFRIDDNTTQSKSVDLVDLILTGGSVNSTFANRFTDSGGAIYTAETLKIRNSTLTQNQTTGDALGAAVFSADGGSLEITSSTFTGNSASSSGGAIYNASGSQLELSNSTITGNLATSSGGGISNHGVATLLNTIVAGNRVSSAAVPSDVDAVVALQPESSHNLIGAGTGSGLVDSVNGNIVGIDWKTVLHNDGVDPILRNNGGLTPTVALIAGSPAIDAANLPDRSVLDTSFSVAEGYTNGKLQSQQPNNQGPWIGQNIAHVDVSSGQVTSVGGPFDRNAYSVGARGGTGGVPSINGFAAHDSLAITIDYQFNLDSNANRGLADIGFRTDHGLGTGYESSPQQGFRIAYVSAISSVSFSPNLHDSSDPFLVPAELLGLNPAGSADFDSAPLRIRYQAQNDGDGNWTVIKFSVTNLQSNQTFLYAGPTKSFHYSGSDAFYAQSLVRHGQTTPTNISASALAVRFGLAESVFDQRGAPFARVSGAQVDIGAFEFQSIDFGDAPDSYRTSATVNGPSHQSVGPRLGELRDGDLGGVPSADATSDDLANNSFNIDDEDGVLFGAITPGLTAGINIDLQNATSAKVDAWIDFNRDGVWDDASEQILTNRSVNSGLQTINYDVPAGAVPGVSFARVRVSSLGSLSPIGPAGDGEVEDYAVTIGTSASNPIATINNDRTTRSEITSIEVQFNSVVEAVASDFVLTNAAGEAVTGIVVSRNDTGGSTLATLTFTGGSSILNGSETGLPPTLAGGIYQLRYRPSVLDGSDPPIAIDKFFRKYGDANGDDSVGLADFASFRSAFGTSFDPGNLNNGFDSGLDANRDGSIGLADFASFRSAFGS